ncbi:MAG: PDZ domain-containing protein, partial [Myxococcota bacterium]
MKLVTPRANVGARIDLPPIRAPHSQPIDEHALRLPVDGNERVGSQRGGIPRVELHRAKVEVSLPREWQMAVAQYAATQIKTHFSYDRPNGVASGTLHKLNDVLSYKILNGFADNLDPGREFLTQEVIDGWQQRFGDKFDDVLKSGDLRIVFALYNDYRQIVAGRLNWCLEQLQKPFDLEAEDTLRIPKNDTWSRDTASLDVQWLKRMKLRVIDDVLSGKDVAESHKKFAAELADVELRPSFSRDEERVSEWGFDAFMNGYFGSLDRFSRYVPPSEMNRMEARSRGSFSGIGCTISIKYEPDASGVYKRQVKLGSVTEGGPAERAGVRAGDRLISIRDHATDELTVLE